MSVWIFINPAPMPTLPWLVWLRTGIDIDRSLLTLTGLF